MAINLNKKNVAHKDIYKEQAKVKLEEPTSLRIDLDEVFGKNKEYLNKEIRKTMGISMRPSYHHELTELAKSYGMKPGHFIEKVVANIAGFEYKKDGKARS